MKLSKAEEQLMDIIWSKGKVFFKDIVDSYSDPKPASTTVATLLKRIQDKDFISYKVFGNSRQYYPLVEKETYFSKGLKEMVKDYFNDSALQFASFFTRTSDMTEAELKDLKSIVEHELKKKKQ
jgi:BlaI family transcriptional regulator, penicillinase repressor